MAQSGGRSRGGRGAERRQAPRIEILGQLDGYLMTVDTPVRVLDVSSGGFGVETAHSLNPGDIHECRFELRAGVAVILLARVQHCRSKKGPRASQRYLAGFQFLEATPEAEAGRAQLMERVSAILERK
jgi:PilZ domain-containing protein